MVMVAMVMAMVGDGDGFGEFVLWFLLLLVMFSVFVGGKSEKGGRSRRFVGGKYQQTFRL
jgi:hypothetical protein